MKTGMPCNQQKTPRLCIVERLWGTVWLPLKELNFHYESQILVCYRYTKRQYK